MHVLKVTTVFTFLICSWSC